MGGGAVAERLVVSRNNKENRAYSLAAYAIRVSDITAGGCQNIAGPHGPAREGRADHHAGFGTDSDGSAEDEAVG